jgi:ABC-type branched-subunit amino acid transport system substrate-binding protein
MDLLRVVLVALVCATSACATAATVSTRTVSVDGQQMLAEDYAKSLLDEADAAVLRHDGAAARAGYHKIRAELKDTSWFGAASTGLARLLLEAGDAQGAQAIVEELLLIDPTTPVAGEARYVLALAQLAQGDSTSAAPTLKSLVDKMPADQRASAMATLGRELLSAGQGAEAARYLSRARDAGARDVDEELNNVVDTMVSFGDLRLLLESEAQAGSLLDEVLTMKLARVHLHLRDMASSSEMAQRYLQRYPTGRYATQANSLQQALASRLIVAPKSVGVLLPLSGEYAAYGKRALTAMKLGFGVVVKPEEPPAEPELDPATGEPVVRKKKATKLDESFSTPLGLKIIVKDTAGEAAKAAAHVKDLVERDHVIALLGDILLETSLPAALAAEDAGVPLLNLSRRDGVPEAGPWSYRLALTARKQAQALVALAVDGIGMKRFAIMYPKHSFGIELMNELWNELDKRHAEVTAVESYAHDQTTFTAEAKSLVGRGTAGSGEVAQCRAEAAHIGNEYRRKKAAEGCGDLAKPIVDFEALFIPDSYRNVSFVIPALVAEDVLVTNDRRTVEAYRKTTSNTNVRPVQLLGVSMWNDPELGRRLGRQIDGAIFVDGFDAQDGTPVVQKFLKAFDEAHGSRPQLVEAQAHDGAALMSALLTGAKTRDQLRAALAAAKDFPGVTGLIRFDEHGDSATTLRFFQVDGDHIESREASALATGERG